MQYILERYEYMTERHLEPDTTVKKKSIMMRKIGASVIFAAVSFFWLGFSYVFAANLFGDDIGKSPEEYELFVPVT